MNNSISHKSEKLIAINDLCYYSLISKIIIFENMEINETNWMQKGFLQSGTISEKHIITERRFNRTNKGKLNILKEKAYSFDIGLYLSKEKAISANTYCFSPFEFMISSSGIVFKDQDNISPIISLKTLIKGFAIFEIENISIITVIHEAQYDFFVIQSGILAANYNCEQKIFPVINKSIVEKYKSLKIKL